MAAIMASSLNARALKVINRQWPTGGRTSSEQIRLDYIDRLSTLYICMYKYIVHPPGYYSVPQLLCWSMETNGKL